MNINTANLLDCNFQEYILIIAKITLQEYRNEVYMAQYLAIFEEMNIFGEKPISQILTTINSKEYLLVQLIEDL